MDDEKLENSKIIRLTEKFARAVKNKDKKVIERIIGADLKIETKIIGNGSVQEFDVSKLDEIFIVLNLRETKRYLYKKRNEVQAVFEINSDWHLNETDFQSGFIRQTFSYCRFSNSWKLKRLKTEFLRVSRYNLKESVGGILTWLLIKAYRVNG